MTTTSSISSSQSTTYEQLLSIFEKVAHGVGLTALERGVLTRCSETGSSLVDWAWSFIVTPKDQPSVQKLDGLAQGMLKGEVSVAQGLSEVQSHRPIQDLSARETAAFAKLIRACLSREDLFTSVLSQFRTEKRRDPTRQELIKLVAQFNQTVSPHIQEAGLDVAEVKYFNDRLDQDGILKVRYDARGYLEITEGPIAPVKECYDQTLTEAQVVEVRRLYDSLSQETPYNNLGELLEFIRYFNQQKKTQPDLTIKQAFDSYHPDLTAIFRKYESGTCILLASTFCEELEKQGVKAQILSTLALNPWTALPIPGLGEEIRWMAFTQELRGVEHSDAVCFFKDEKNKKMILRFRCSFEKDEANEVIRYQTIPERTALSHLTFEVGEREMPNEVIDPSFIGKTRLRGRHKALVKKDEMIFGIDFLRGNLYFKPSGGADALKGLPLNAQKRVSIDIQDLANPDAKGTYIVDGQKTELTHRRALRMILEKVGKEVSLSADMEENLIILAQNAPEFVDDFLLQPLALIKEGYTDLLEIDKKLKSFEDKIDSKELDTLKQRADELRYAVCNSEEGVLEKVKLFRVELEKLKAL